MQDVFHLHKIMSGTLGGIRPNGKIGQRGTMGNGTNLWFHCPTPFINTTPSTTALLQRLRILTRSLKKISSMAHALSLCAVEKLLVVVAFCIHQLPEKTRSSCTTKTPCARTPLSTSTTGRSQAEIVVIRQRTPAEKACLMVRRTSLSYNGSTEAEIEWLDARFRMEGIPAMSFKTVQRGGH